MTTLDAAGQKMTKRDLAIVIVLAAMVTGLGLTRMTPGVVGFIHDDGIYVATARSLAEGSGYRLIDLPGAPLQTKYPFLYPALLSLIWRGWPSFPANVVAMQWLSLLATATTVGLSFLYLVRFAYTTRPVALLSCALCATVMMLLYLGTQAMSEGVFGLLTLAALWRCEVALRRPYSGAAWQVATGVILTMPFLCRLLGISLLATALALLTIHRKPRGWMAGVFACTVCGWLMWAWLLPAPSDPAITAYYTTYVSSVTSLLTPSWWRIVSQNALLIVMSGAGMPLEGLRTASAAGAASALLFLLFGCVGWISIIRAATRAVLLPAFVSVYALIAVIWPWPPLRFLVPILPLMAGLVFQAAWDFGSKAPRRVRLALLASGALIFLGALTRNVGADVRMAQANQRHGYPIDGTTESSSQVDAETASWASYEETFGWLREHTNPGDVIASGFDSMVFLYTGRQTYRPVPYRPLARYDRTSPPAGFADDVTHLLLAGQAQYLVLFPAYEFDKPLRRIVELIQSRDPNGLREVFRGTDPRFVVFQLHLGHASPGHD